MQHTPGPVLVQRSRAGQSAAFAELFTRHARSVFGYLYRVLGDRSWAEELTLETFVHAHRYLARLGSDDAFRAWLYRIANDLMTEGVQAGRRPTPPPAWDSGGVPAPSGPAAAAQAAVWHTLQQLPDNYREALVLREFSGLSYAEIAAVLDSPVQAVRTILYRARVLFRDLYVLQTVPGGPAPESDVLPCAEVGDLISAAQDGELTTAERSGLKAHLARCSGCQKLQRDLAAVSRALATLKPVALPPELVGRFAAYLGVRPAPPAGPEAGPVVHSAEMPRHAPWLVLALAGSGLLVVVVLAGLVLLLRSRAGGTGVVTPSPATSPAVTVAAGSPVATAVAGGSTSTPRPTSTPTRPPASPTPSAGDLPSATSSASPAVTETPVLTVSVTPAGTPAIRFWADATTIAAGSCTIVRWEVANVRAVFLDGAGVAGAGAQETCPCITEIHRLEVQLNDGTRQVRELTITVNGTCTTPSPSATPDVEPPSVPVPLMPVDTVLDCRLIVALEWAPSDDPSGIAGYYVRLEERLEGSSQLVGEWGPLAATQTDVFVACGHLYRWAVQAEDRAANRSPWSGWAQFAIGSAAP